MSICQSCGGTIGVDCFNPQECMGITRDMAMRGGEAGQYIAELESQLATALKVIEESRKQEPLGRVVHGVIYPMQNKYPEGFIYASPVMPKGEE